MPFVVDNFFLEELENSHRKAFALADLAMADDSIVSGSCGTTALTAMLSFSDDIFWLLMLETVVQCYAGEEWLLITCQHMSLKNPFTGSSSLLISDPEIQQIILTDPVEFLILACDGIWDVLSSQNAVNNVRKGLRRHDSRQSAMELGKEAARLNSSDNLTVVVICLSSVPSSPQQPQRKRLRFFV
ncbi:hypothetical protein N665_0455s0006 [Sinapis alba]|nr:hypothetical protein N665_0455s0006 [Sinapis alba]